MKKTVPLFLAALALALAPARAVEDKISHVNVLLPWRRRGASAPASATGGSSTSSRSPVEPTTQLLEAKPGCFRWESNSPDVAEVIPQYENDAEREARCSSRAVVRAVWPHAERAMSLVSAIKMDSAMQHVLGYELQCEVWVAPIARIQILTTVRTLSLGNTEKIEVQAFDDRDNVFTSLAGLHFDWRDVDSKVLRVIRLKSTNVIMTEAQEKVESEGKMGDSVQIEGVKTGRGGLEVTPLDKGYDHMSATVEINVTQPLKIQPRSAVYIAPASELQMELWTNVRTDSGFWRPERIFMPTDHYKWEVGASKAAGESDAVAVRVDENMGMAVAQHTGGPASVVARDQEILDHFAFHKLTVSTPTSLALAMARRDDQLSTSYIYTANGGTLSTPENEAQPWYLVLGREYAVIAVLRDEDHHRMYLTPNVKFDIQYGVVEADEDGKKEFVVVAGNEDFTGRIVETSEEGSSALAHLSSRLPAIDLRRRPEWGTQRRWVKATAVGRTYVHAEMLPVVSTFFAGEEDPVVYRPPNGPLRTSTLCIVSHPVALVHPPDHPPVLLPPDQSFRLHATGGTGDYVWTMDKGSDQASGPSSPSGSSETAPNAIASVHKKDGIVTTNTELGDASLLAEDAANRYNSALTKVVVASVEGIHFIDGPLEAEVVNGAATDSKNIKEGSGGSSRSHGQTGGRQDGDLYVRVGASDARSNRFHACDSIFHALTVDNALFDSTVFEIVNMFPGNVDNEGSIESVDATEGSPSTFVPYVTGSDRYSRSQACMTLRLRPLREGTTTLKISFGTGARRLTASVEITAFPPLEVLVPGVMKTTVALDEDTHGIGDQWGVMPTTVVSLGATARVQLSGGPPPRGMKGMGRQTIDSVTMQRPDDIELEFYPPDAAEDEELARKGARDQSSGKNTGGGMATGDCKSSPPLGETGLLPGRRYALKCKALGEQNVTFTVTNVWSMLARPESMARPHPVLRTVVVRFVCSTPIHTQLILQSGASIMETGCSTPVDEEVNEDDDETNDVVANDLDADPSYIIRTRAPVPVYLRVLDHACRPFMNFSTVLTSWGVTAGSAMADFSGNLSPVQLLHRECIRRIVSGKSSGTSFADDYGEVDLSVVRECLRDQQSAQNSGLPGPNGEYDTSAFSTSRDLVELGESSTMLERAFIFSAAMEGTAKIRVNASACAHTNSVGQIQDVHASRRGQKSMFGRGCPRAQLKRGASLQLVRNVRLTPQRATIFRHPDNVLTISAVDGSGQFSFTSSVGPEFAAIGQNSSKSVELSPGRRNGRALVTVTDTGLTETMCATSDVFISEVARLEIWVKGAKIALGEELPLHVMAYPVDSADGAPEEAFSQDQLALMNVTFQNDQSLAFVRVHRTESNRSSIGNAQSGDPSSVSPASFTKSSSSSASSILDLLDFTVRGLVVGRHRITASVTNKNLDPKNPGRYLTSTVRSAALILHVFPPLVVLPRRLVLLPGAHFDLKIQGGPGGSSQNVFRVTNDSLASVGQHGMVVTGHANEGMLGDAVVTVHAEGTSHRTQKPVVYARDAIPIRVALLTDIAIAAPSRKMLVGSMMKLRVRGKSFETPFTFGSSNITFDWRSENGDILSIEHHRRHLTHSGSKINDDDYYASFSDHDSTDFAVWVNAKAAGKSVVHVTVISRPRGFPVQTFTHSIPFTVVAPLQLISPPSLLLWPGATATLRTNADVNQKLHYTQANSKWVDSTSASSTGIDGDDSTKQEQTKTSPPSLVSFEGHGVIRAGNVQGRTTVTIFNEAEEQAVTVAVEVKDVAQMTLVGDTTMYVGEEKQLQVRLTDDLGRPFDLDDSTLAVSTLFNNQSVFSLSSSGSSGSASDSEHRQNHSFTARANYEGETIVKFWRDGTSPAQISVDLGTAQTLAAMQSALVPKVFSEGTAEVLEANTRIADYASLRAIHRIYPQGSLPPEATPSASLRLLLHVGAACNFTSEASEHEWWSDDSQLLTVNKATGQAYAGTDTGSTYVNHRGLLTNRARVVISRVEKMTLDSSDPTDTSGASSLVVVPGREFVFPISVYGEDNAKLEDHVENSSLQQNVRITCHIHEQAISHAMGLGGRALGRWGIVKAYGRHDPHSGQHFCVVNITEPSESDWKTTQDEFPRVDVLSFSARASDSQGTYSFTESFPNLIPYVPKMRVRVTYPHETVTSSSAASSAPAYASGNYPAPGDAGGKPLLGCVELQPSKGEVSAFIDVYRKRSRSGGADGSGGTEKPIVDAHEDVSAVLVQREKQQDGWTRFRYLVTPNMKARSSSGVGAFEQRVITFTQPSTGTTKDICVSYGQRHEHRWYCAVTDASLPMPSVFRRSACGQCPPLSADAPSNMIDSRYREMRCCTPDAGIECVAPDEVTSTYRCNAADRPDKDCTIFNHAADGLAGGGKTRRRYEDMSDNEIVENSLPMMIFLAVLGMGTATYLFGDNFFATVQDTLRTLLCPSNHRDPRRMAARSAAPGAPAPAFGSRAADLHQDRARGHRDAFYRRNAPAVVGAGRRGVGAGGYGAGVRAQAYDPVEEFIDR